MEQFDWTDAFVLDDQLSDEERMIRDTARGSVANSDTVSKIGLMYCQGQLR